MSLLSPDTSAALSLLSARAVRERAHRLLAIGLDDQLPHFRIDLGRMDAAVDLVLATTRAAYPSLDVPFHSRWRHFVTGGDNRWAALAHETAWQDKAARARAEFDLAIVSVFLDAGAGPSWRYHDPRTGQAIGRSEGLGLASLAMFASGAFSADPAQPLRADASVLEKLSVADTLRAVRFAEVVVLMMDSQNKFEEQDLRIADLVEREGRALVLAVNKWDLVEKQGGQIGALRTDADHLLPQIRGVPVVAISGLMGEGVERLMKAIQDAYAVWNRRIPTAGLNRWFEDAIDKNPPPSVSGRRLKLNYVTQNKARPPSFVVFCSRADAVPTSYLRYLTNTLREAFDLPGTPIRITLREKANPFAHKRKRPN